MEVVQSLGGLPYSRYSCDGVTGSAKLTSYNKASLYTKTGGGGLEPLSPIASAATELDF